MKVLHLPSNVASQISTTVRGLKLIGIDARGLVTSETGAFFRSNDGVDVLPPPPPLPRSVPWAVAHGRRVWSVLSAIARTDVLHWHYGDSALPRQLDISWTELLHKKGVAEFWGSDIRIAEIAKSDNPYFSKYAPAEYQEQLTSRGSNEKQRRFGHAGFHCLVPDGELLSYVQTNLFAKTHLVRQRIMTSDYASAPPDPAIRRPLIVHSPSNPKLKGTEFVLAAVEKLRSKLEFEFRLIQNMPRSQALSLVAQADVFVDQLIMGSHGLAALEAMAFGKPVICFIKPSLKQSYPADLPIVSANPDNLFEVLGALIRDGSLRQQSGLRSRAYVEKHHDAVVIARQLREIYAELGR